MLDVYRSYYGMSGEPFRLGPDYRFSLHHTSYANAKAYLDYAIYQGEGFIAITGGPGTGKTTLISEILATLDRSRVHVATLTSTQLESRDLLHMVASAFGMHPDRFEKAELLLEIEAFLVKKIRSGERAILIVDEAQGLSPAALEELRLLANLQYQYQLLLQICLVGQERLLEVIHAPGMEHLQQRLVAATTLEPLGFDETIDYIEHRLSKVGWKGDPAIEEAALRLIYRYSGGTPRRINLVVNRLFLYGGMEQKHRLSGADAQAVIDGLVEEHLLGAQPLIAEEAIRLSQPAPGSKAKTRSLPRSDGAANKPARPAASAAQAGSQPGPDKQRRSAADGLKVDSENLPGSRPQARASGSGPVRQAAPPPAADATVRNRQPSFSRRGPEPPRDELLYPRRPLPETGGKNSGSKSLILVALLLVAAGGAYYLISRTGVLDRVYEVVGGGSDTPAPAAAPAPVTLDDSPDRPPVITAGGDETPDSGESTFQSALPGSEKGTIIREPVTDALDEADGDTAMAPAAQTAEVGNDGVPLPDQLPDSTQADVAAPAAESQIEPAATVVASARQPAPEPAMAPVLMEPGRQAQTAAVAPPAAPDPARAQAEPASTGNTADAKPPSPTPQAAVEPAAVSAPAPPPVAPVKQPAAEQSRPDVDAIAARREQLQQAAERRFSRQLAQAQSTVVTAPVAPAASAVTAAPVTASQPKTSTPAAKPLPLTTVNDIKTMLLEGRWNSGNNPASLLPSATTFCKPESAGISCVSVPQNVKTQYGLALYKVESQLSGFSAEGLFEMSYRTLVKLVGAQSPGGKPAASAGSGKDWQVTEYSMSCKISGSDRVSCLDGKGITREYRRLPR